MSAKKFLDHLESQGFLDDSVISELRAKVNNAKTRITPEAVAKLLVDKGHLTKFQATKIISDLVAGSGQESPLSAPDDDDDVVMLEDASSGGLTSQAPAVPQTSAAQQAPVQQAPAPPAQVAAPPGGLTPLAPAPAAGLTPVDGGGLTPMGGAAPAGGVAPGPAGAPATGPAGNTAQAAAGPEPKKYSKAPPGRKKATPGDSGSHEFNSMKFFVVFGTLLTIVIIGGFLYFSLTRGTAADLFSAAETDYSDKSYSQAVDKYNMLLKNYPSDENASLANVRIGMSRIWQNSGDPGSALDSAKQVLPTIEGEEAFAQALPELATILPNIASQFAERAKEAETTEAMAEFVAKTEEAMELVNNSTYLSDDLRRDVSSTLKTVDETLVIVRQVIKRDEDLATTVAGMKQATEAGDTAKAYQLRAALLKLYAGLETQAELLKAVALITESEKKQVKNEPPSLQVLTADVPQPPVAKESFSLQGGKVAGLENQVVTLAAGGGVYALNASAGTLLWRRQVGPNARQPLRVTPEVDSDLLINNSARNELVRVQVATGKPVWRVPIGQPFQGPAIKDDIAFVSTRSGAVIGIDLASGKAQAQAVAPIAFTVAPGFGARRPQLYQIGDQKNVYTFGAEDLKCNEVFYLGHKSGTVQTPPAMLLGHLFVAENAGPDYTQLHILASNQTGLELRRAQAPLRLQGRVVVPMIVTGRRLVVVTDLGCVYVLDVDAANKTAPVANAVKPLILQQKKVAYPLVDRGLLWIGDNRFTRYDVQVSRAELSRKWVKLQGYDFVAPLQQFGNSIFGVRAMPGSAGVTVSAIEGESGDETWRATIATPPGNAAAAPNRDALLVTSRRHEPGA